MPRENLVGRTIAGYVVEREVGEGGTSSVFEANHPEHGHVALKILRERLRQDPTAVARFVREAQFGSRVVHEHVVRTIETGVSDEGMPYLAIEWAKGDILERYVKRNGALDAAEVSTIVLQIGAAVDAAHCQKIVHRDLKPDNVVYDPESRCVKLLDFGIAADTTTPAEERLTRAGFFVGTLMYVAPEALSGELVGPQADQYSLATIAYFLLTGCLPYTAKTPREMFSQLLSQPPIALNQARPGMRFSNAVEQVVMRGLSREPGKRYPNVVAFADALREAIESSGTASAGGDGLFAKVRSIFRR